MSFNFFFKKKEQNLFRDLVDFHNHILPAIDDGSKSVAQSLKMLNLFMDLGIQSLIASPHIYRDLYPNTPNSIAKSFETFKEKANHYKFPVKGYGAEYLVDEFFLENLKKNIPLLCCFERNVLVEIPFFSTTKLLEQAHFTMQNMEYTAILAHPERYAYLEEASLKNLKSRGLKTQLNALSLFGYYGPDIKKKASRWLVKGLYDFVGTDAHNEHQLKALKNLQLNKKQLFAWEKVCEIQSDLIII
jgi:protein-tyrosine phosphatase